MYFFFLGSRTDHFNSLEKNGKISNFHFDNKNKIQASALNNSESKFHIFMQKAEGKQRLSTTGLKSHRNSIIFKGNINDSSPKGESPNTRKNLFSRRKKSLGDLQTNRTYTKQTSIRRDNHIHNELQEFLEHYSKNINLRRISESNHQKKSLEKLHFQSPLIKDKKSEFDNYEFNKITTEQKKIIKPVSHLKQKLQIFIEKFQRKKMRGIS